MALTHHSLLRLRRSTVRKGFAFPAPVKFESSEAMPRKLRGVASKAFKRSTESHRLSAVCGGKAAIVRMMGTRRSQVNNLRYIKHAT